MTMDLWYDLAARERPDLDDALIERFEGAEMAPHVPEAEGEVVLAVDFF